MKLSWTVFAIVVSCGPIFAGAEFPLLRQNARTIPQSTNQQPAYWIWADTSVNHIYIRQKLKLPEDVSAATLQVSSKGPFEAAINGSRAATGIGGEADQLIYVSHFLQAGSNVFTVEARTNGTEYGVKFVLSIKYKSGKTAVVLSNGDELIHTTYQQGWDTPEFKDNGWKLSTVLKGLPPTMVNVPTKTTVTEIPVKTPPATNIIQPAAPKPIVITPPVPPVVPKSTIVEKPAEITTPKTVPTPTSPVKPVATVLNIDWDTSHLNRLFKLPDSNSKVISQHVPMFGRTNSLDSVPILAANNFAGMISEYPSATSGQSSQATTNLIASMEANGMMPIVFTSFQKQKTSNAPATKTNEIRCLEHDKPGSFVSPWDPSTRTRITEQLNGMKKQFPDLRAVEAGIFGDTGFASMMVSATSEDPHSHTGWWCNDKSALAAFRKQVLEKYKTVKELNTAWQTSYPTSEDVTFPKGPSDGSKRRWLDFIAFYRSGISGLVQTNLEVLSQLYPKAIRSVLIPAEEDDIKSGTDLASIMSTAKSHDGVVRAVGLGKSGFASSASGELGRLAGGAKAQGANLWFENAPSTSGIDIAERIFTAISLDAKGWVDSPDNVLKFKQGYSRQGQHLLADNRIVDVAMFYPSTFQNLKSDSTPPATFRKACSDIRDVLDFAVLDEDSIRADGLAGFRILVLWEGSVIEQTTLAKIKRWVETGGVVIACDFGKIENVEGDKSWFTELFGYAGKLSPAKPMSRFSSDGPLPGRYRINLDDVKASPFLSGDWGTAATRRFGRTVDGVGVINLPFDPNQHKFVHIKANCEEQKGQKLRYEVLINNVLSGYIDAYGDRVYTFQIPSSLKSDQMQVVIRRGTQSSRRASKSVPTVIYIEVNSDSNRTAPSDPGLPAGRFDTTFDLVKLKSEWARPFQKGWTVYFPGNRNLLPTYYELVRYLTYHLSDLDATKPDAIPVDNKWDGVYATLFSDRAVFFNGTKEPVKLTASFTPPQKNGKQIERITSRISLESKMMSVVNFAGPPQLRLFQCEGFGNLGGLKPNKQKGFFTADDVNNVLIPANQSISGLIKIETAGRYRVFYRTTRRNKIVPAEILIDNRLLSGSENLLGSNFAQQTLFSGEVDLTAGGHSIVVRPKKGESIRADFIILTTDKNIGGYAFDAPADKP